MDCYSPKDFPVLWLVIFLSHWRWKETSNGGPLIQVPFSPTKHWKIFRATGCWVWLFHSRLLWNSNTQTANVTWLCPALSLDPTKSLLLKFVRKPQSMPFIFRVQECNLGPGSWRAIRPLINFKKPVGNFSRVPERRASHLGAGELWRLGRTCCL